MTDLDPTALKARMDKPNPPILLDVRERWEYDRAKLPDATLIPLAQLEEKLSSLDPEAEYVVYCHHGGRSASAVKFLRSKGFGKVSNLEGGIDAWSLEVDATVARY